MKSLSLSLSLSLSIPIDFPPGMADWQVARVPPYVRRPFPSKENRQISERDYLGPHVVPGGQEIGLGSRNLRPSGGTSYGARRLQGAAR